MWIKLGDIGRALSSVLVHGKQYYNSIYFRLCSLSANYKGISECFSLFQYPLSLHELNILNDSFWKKCKFQWILFILWPFFTSSEVLITHSQTFSTFLTLMKLHSLYFSLVIPSRMFLWVSFLFFTLKYQCHSEISLSLRHLCCTKNNSQSMCG